MEIQKEKILKLITRGLDVLNKVGYDTFTSQKDGLYLRMEYTEGRLHITIQEVKRASTEMPV